MRRTLPLTLALLAGLATFAQAQTPGAPAAFREGQRVVLLGQITSAPKLVAGVREERKMQVAIGPEKTDYTLHLSEAAIFGATGQKAGINDLGDKQWIRAEGAVMEDPRRIKVTKLQVIGKDTPSLQRSAFYRPGFDQGYVMAVAGSREVFPATPGTVVTPAPLVIVGKVSDDTGALETTRKIQVDAAGNTWTLHVPKEAPVVDTKGEKISVHEISKGQWLRAHGWQTDDLRMRVARIQNIGREEAFRTSAFYRAAEPMGYVERTPGTGVRFDPVKITGVITTIDEASGFLTLRDEQGVDRTIWLDTMTIYAGDRPVDVKALQKGQRVTVQGSEIRF